MLTCISRYSGGLSTVQLQADPADPLTGSGEATLGAPGRYCATVAGGTTRHAFGTWRSSPGWNVVMSAPGVTDAGPRWPQFTNTTASPPPTPTTAPPPRYSPLRRLRAAARSARPPVSRVRGGGVA